jgi:hypothetical protein
MIVLAKSHSGIEATEAMMTSVDHLGFSLRLKINDRVKGTCNNFVQELDAPQDTLAVLAEMVRQARWPTVPAQDVLLLATFHSSRQNLWRRSAVANLPPFHRKPPGISE